MTQVPGLAAAGANMEPEWGLSALSSSSALNIGESVVSLRRDHHTAWGLPLLVALSEI